MRVKKVMQVEVPTLKKEAKIKDAAELIIQKGTGCVAVVENNSPIGIVTELDLVRNFVHKGKKLDEPISKIMASPVTCMAPDTKLDEALKIIDTKKFRKYPVIEGSHLVGLVTKKDVVNAISDNVRLHRNIQNAVLVLFVLFELFIFVISKYVPFGA